MNASHRRARTERTHRGRSRGFGQAPWSLPSTPVSAIHHGTRRHDRALSYPHTIRDNSPGTQPYIIFDHNTFSRNTLLNKWTRWVIEDMIYSNDLCERRSVNAIPDLYPTLATDH